MPKDTQIRTFDIWASKNSIDLELHFEPLLKKKLRKLLAGVILVIGAASYSIEKIEMGRALILPMAILQIMVSKSKPTTKARTSRSTK
jgi:hypothetical protein